MKGSIGGLTTKTCKDNKDHIAFKGQYEKKENVVILAPDTIVQPNTVMVVAIDTFIAYIAMLGSWCSYNLTSRAQVLYILDFLDEAHKI